MAQELLAEIDRFLIETGMAESSFGRGAVRDWRFVRGLRTGRRAWPETADRCRQFMDDCRKRAAETASEPVRPAAPAELNRWAGRTVTCAVCERRLSDSTVRACQAPDCPQSEREAA